MLRTHAIEDRCLRDDLLNLGGAHVVEILAGHGQIRPVVDFQTSGLKKQTIRSPRFVKLATRTDGFGCFLRITGDHFHQNTAGFQF